MIYLYVNKEYKVTKTGRYHNWILFFFTNKKQICSLLSADDYFLRMYFITCTNTNEIYSAGLAGKIDRH